MSILKTSDFNFTLPPELIATHPVSPRDSSKMIVWKDSEMQDDTFFNLPNFLTKGDVLVFNDTKVIKAKLIGKRGDARIEINLHQDLGDGLWQVFAKPAKKLKIADKFIIDDEFFAMVVGKNEDGTVNLQFNVSNDDFFSKLEKYGKVPLPPYIKREHDEYREDSKNYQTIYAKNNGAVAAPTAGLHFTTDLMESLKKKGVQQVFVTLNVGAGTFLPVKSENIIDHKMHSEYFTISSAACDQINNAKKDGKRIIAVGTTSLRVLESTVDEDGILQPQCKNTDIFIYPPYNFKVVDMLITNFHLPKSTLFMLISAFIGQDAAADLYKQAILKKYRFYSFGDSSLLFRNISS